VLGYSVLYESEHEVNIAKAADRYPGIAFVPVSDVETTRNRLHIDLDPIATIPRCLALLV